VFMEKPLSTDAPGARRILAAGKVAEEKGLCVVVGLQNRYALRYQKVKELIDQGEIGDITSMSCNYLIGGVRQIDRQPGQTEMEYQLRNWRHFEWLWGGSPAALTIHVEDLAHWMKGSYPVRAFGTGGREGLSGPEHGDIYDHFYIEYEYEDGTRLHSRTRTINGCWLDRSSLYEGTEGKFEIPMWRDAALKKRNGETTWSYQDTDDPSPYQTEHDIFFRAIRTGEYINDTEWAGMSNMTSIMGRMAVKSGQRIEWDEAFNSDLLLVPDDLTFDSDPPVLPDDTGNYPVIKPGSRNRVL
jgi:myo-inositol 2-dehydrogenase / D-chiro-inositol 1-dehydrogenase